MAGAADSWNERAIPPKLRRTLVTPEGVGLDISVASAGARVGAMALDIAIIVAILLAFFVILFVLVISVGSNASIFEGGLGEFIAVVAILFVFLLRNAYFLYFELGDRGATWGKRAVGIRIAARDGGRLTAEAVIARNLMREVELFLPLIFLMSAGGQGALTGPTALAGFGWVAIFLFFPLLNRDRMRAGDLIAGTWVVYAPRAALGEVVARSGAATTSVSERSGATYRFSEAELSVYGEYELQTLETVLRHDNEDALVTVCEAICRKIGWNPGEGDERAFLEAYYTQLRARLEGRMRFGKRRADKFSEEG